MRKSKASLAWLLKMAWRDSRKNWNRLFLFTSSIILGIAALVAISSFGDNLKQDINNQAKELLGADLVINGRQKPDSLRQLLLDSLQKISLDQAREVSFGSMVFFPESKGTRLANVRALEGNYPFYGELETTSENSQTQFLSSNRAVVDQTLMLQFEAQVGQKIKVGQVEFEIETALLQAPGQNNIASTVAPKVYIPYRDLAKTRLVQPGSRLVYRYYYKFPQDYDIEALEAQISKRFREADFGITTVEESKARLGNAFQILTRFLNLVAFIALLLGSVGVASAVQVYLKEKVNTVAILRCLGAESRQAFYVFLLQIALVGLLGSVIGALLGSGVQVLLPLVLQDFLPVEVSYSISWPAIAQGILLGLSVSLLFALLPLFKVLNISPLRTLRASVEEKKASLSILSLFAYSLITAFVFLFAYSQIRSFWESLYFTGFVFFALAVLSSLARLLMYVVRRFFPVSWSFIWRQSIANLYRPNNQTLTLILTIGLGTGMIVTLNLIQGVLLGQVELSDDNNQPNMVLFDIQTDQRKEVKTLLKEFNLPLRQELPIVAMRLKEFKGRSRQEWLKDSIDPLPRDILNREYRVSYRDELEENERLVKGKLPQDMPSAENGAVYVTVSETHARRMRAEVGDEIIFNVQGTPVKTIISGFRSLDLTQFRPSFTFVFPRGVLEEAPQFFVAITRTPSKKASAEFQQALIRDYPNVSVVDITLIINSVQEVLDKVSFVIRFMALFSILTGILVLVASVRISKYQRVKESVLLRTLGARQGQILWINALEYFMLGGLSSLAGIFLAILASWAWTVYIFQSDFFLDLGPLVYMFLGITGLTVAIGLFNSRGIVQRPPLEVLRKEVS